MWGGDSRYWIDKHITFKFLFLPHLSFPTCTNTDFSSLIVFFLSFLFSLAREGLSKRYFPLLHHCSAASCSFAWKQQHIQFLCSYPDEPKCSKCSKTWFKTSVLLRARRKSLMKTWPKPTHLYISLTWMLHELLIYSIRTCYDCITIYLSISDSPGWLPWGFTHIQSRPLWHTLLSLFKYPVTSPLVQAHRDMSLKAVSLSSPGFLPVRLVTDWFSPVGFQYKKKNSPKHVI